MQAEAKERGEARKPSQTRGQTSAPHVYELTKDAEEAGPFLAITGNILDPLFFNSVDWHGTELVRPDPGRLGRGRCLMSLGRYPD